MGFEWTRNTAAGSAGFDPQLAAVESTESVNFAIDFISYSANPINATEKMESVSVATGTSENSLAGDPSSCRAGDFC